MLATINSVRVVLRNKEILRGAARWKDGSFAEGRLLESRARPGSSRTTLFHLTTQHGDRYRVR